MAGSPGPCQRLWPPRPPCLSLQRRGTGPSVHGPALLPAAPRLPVTPPPLLVTPPSPHGPALCTRPRPPVTGSSSACPAPPPQGQVRSLRQVHPNQMNKGRGPCPRAGVRRVRAASGSSPAAHHGAGPRVRDRTGASGSWRGRGARLPEGGAQPESSPRTPSGPQSRSQAHPKEVKGAPTGPCSPQHPPQGQEVGPVPPPTSGGAQRGHPHVILWVISAGPFDHACVSLAEQSGGPPDVGGPQPERGHGASLPLDSD